MNRFLKFSPSLDPGVPRCVWQAATAPRSRRPLFFLNFFALWRKNWPGHSLAANSCPQGRRSVGSSVSFKNSPAPDYYMKCSVDRDCLSRVPEREQTDLYSYFGSALLWRKESRQIASWSRPIRKNACVPVFSVFLEHTLWTGNSLMYSMSVLQRGPFARAIFLSGGQKTKQLSNDSSSGGEKKWAYLEQKRPENVRLWTTDKCPGQAEAERQYVRDAPGNIDFSEWKSHLQDLQPSAQL